MNESQASEVETHDRNRKSSNVKHYLLLFVYCYGFGVFTDIVLYGHSFTYLTTSFALGYALVPFAFGFVFTHWGSQTRGWIAVLVVTGLMFFGSIGGT